MPEKGKINLQSIEESNLEILAELIANPNTTKHLTVTILNKLLESKEGQNFFRTIVEQEVSLGACPCCGHVNHWLVPEDELNSLGWITSEKDSEVPRATTLETCSKYSEACSKKKISF